MIGNKSRSKGRSRSCGSLSQLPPTLYTYLILCSSSSSVYGMTGLLSRMGKELLYREVEEVARSALEAQRPCLQICLRHLDKTIREAMAAGYLFNPNLTQGPGGAVDRSVSRDEEGKGTGKGGGVTSTPVAATTTAGTTTAGTNAGASVEATTPAGGGATTASGSVSRFKKSCQLPCPRYCGAVFCGMGKLVCLNARISIAVEVGDDREEEGVGAKAATSSTTIPRTYADLLRKSR